MLALESHSSAVYDVLISFQVATEVVQVPFPIQSPVQIQFGELHFDHGVVRPDSKVRSVVIL
jgi:hypothetical protein